MCRRRFCRERGERESGAAERGVVPTHFVSIGPAAFAPGDSNDEYVRTSLSVYGISAFQSIDFLAPVQLPQGAQILQMRITFIDQTNLGALSVSLLSTTGTTVTNLATFNSTTAVGVQTVDVNLSHTVDNQANAYLIRAAWTTPEAPIDMQVRLVRIGYTLPSAITCDGDINGDSRVDGADLSVLLARFGTVCGP